MKSNSHKNKFNLSSNKLALMRKLAEKEGLDATTAPVITPRGPVRSIPLSFAQQRLWFLDQLEPGSSRYNMSFAFRLTGRLNRDGLLKSFKEIVRRHEILRTTFPIEGESPVQKIIPESDLLFEEMDINDSSSENKEAVCRHIVKEKSRLPFDMSSGPLLRVCLVRFNEDHHVLILTMHHIVSDGWSMGIFYKELSALYNAFSAGGENPLKELPVQYGDFTLWQRKWLSGDKLEKQLEYWKQKLEGINTLELPTDYERPLVQNFNGGMHTFNLTGKLKSSLQAVSRKEKSTLFMILLAGYQNLLQRYSGQSDIVIGTPIASRNYAEIEGLIGFFVNTLVVRIDSSDTPLFKDLLGEVRKTLLDAYAHQDLPFEKLVEELQPTRDLSRNPLFQVGFALQNASSESLELSGLDVEEFEVTSPRAKFDLEISLQDKGDGMEGVVVYNSDLFEQGTVERMASHYLKILESIASDTGQQVSAIPLLTEEERQEILIDWNSLTASYPRDKCIHEMFQEHAARSPEEAAVVFEGKQITYGELNARANQLAGYLIGQGVKPEVPVGIFSDRSLDMIVAMMGVLKSGGAYVPLDPSYPDERLTFMIQDSGVNILLSQKALSSRLTETGAKVLFFDDDLEIPAQVSDLNIQSDVKADNMAYIIYTSGSTGLPKGVVITHRNVVGFLSGYKHVTLDGSRRIGTSVAPFSFDTSVEEIFSNLCYGGTLHIVRPEKSSDTDYFADYLIDNQITTTYILPDFLRGVASRLKQNRERSNLKCVITGLSPKKQSELQCIRDLFEDVRILNSYGPTEVTYGATAFEFTHTAAPEHDTPIGRPFPNYDVYIVDRNLQPVPVGVPGELLIGGVGLARGYLNRPELTAEKFIPHPFKDEPGMRVYRSGDLVRYMSDGNIEFLGRIDDQVKIRGYRVEPREVELVLCGHDELKEAVVMAGDEKAGGKRLVAYYVPNGQSQVTAGDLRSALRKKLPEYMVPSVFVKLDELPRMTNGKVDRRSLPEPDSERPELEGKYVAPRNPEEKIVADIWSELLGIEQVGIEDNFFELGGHSLLATRVLARLKACFKKDIPLRSLFEAPTVAGLTELIIPSLHERHQSDYTVESVQRKGDIPLSFAQQRLWFLDQLEPGSPAYNIPLLFKIKGPLDEVALEKSFYEIVKRHEVLRTSFPASDEQPVQKVADDLPFALHRVDLSLLPESEAEEKASLLTEGEASFSFDLSEGPLMRALLVKTGTEEYLLAITAHHIITDGWSMSILFRELSFLYESYLKGGSSPLEELPVQYADYALWQRNWLKGSRLEEQMNYWKGQLSDIPVIELPADYSRPPVQAFKGGRQKFYLPSETVRALKDLSKKERVTDFMTMLAAFQVLLHRYTGKDDIVVGTPIANRSREEVGDLIGFFVNTLVVRTDISGNPSFSELLNKVRSNLLDAYAHQDLPFEKLVEELRPERDLSRNPLFQISFALQNVPASSLALPGLELIPLEVESTRSKFDLEFYLEEHDKEMSGTIIFSKDLFNPSTIERMAGHYLQLLQGIAANPDRRLSEYHMLTEEEQHRITVEWNDTTPQSLSDKSIHELFVEQAARTPDSKAVIYGDRELSYWELNSQSDKIAHHLRGLGLGENSFAAICVDQSPEMIIGLLAILKTGSAYVPLDPAYPDERIAYIIDDTKPAVVLTRSGMKRPLPDSVTTPVYIDKVLEGSSQESGFVCGGGSPESLAYILYTSGSTGIPKGVCVSHRAVRRLVCDTNYVSIGPSDRIAQASNFSFDAATFEIWGALLNGACLTGIPREVILSPEEFKENMVAEKITIIFLTTALFNQISRETPDAFNSLKCLLFGGEAVDSSCVSNVVRAGPPERFLHVYGPTENTTFTSWYEISGLPDEGGDVPIGRPVSGTSIYILDADLSPVPVGVPGEIYTGGEGVAREYLNQPDLTSGKFITNPFSPGGGIMYRTGDLGRFLHDGNIEFLGRIDDQLKIRGFRIEPAEIQASIDQFGQVRESVVVAQEGKQGSKRLVAFLELKRSTEDVIDRLRVFLKGKLPDYMIPSVFVIVESIPLTPNGKVDRQALEEMKNERVETGASYAAPRNNLEKKLVRLWEDVLDVKPVGINDNFFESGGHSLLAVRLISEIKKATGKKLTVIKLFQSPTIVELAEALRQDSSDFDSSLVNIQTEGGRAPLFWVHDTFLVHYLDKDQPLYVLINPANDGMLPVHSTVEDIASHYVQEMQNARPDGPYILGGYCFWGVVAFEMARQLIMQGHEVPLLFLLNPSLNCLPPLPPGPGLENEIVTTGKKDLCKEEAGCNTRKDILWVKLRKVPSFIKRLILKADDIVVMNLKIAVCRAFLYFGRPVPQSLIEFYVYNVYASSLIRKYKSPGYTGRAVVVQSERDHYRSGDDWHRLSEDEVVTHVIKGADHLDILREPHRTAWINLLKDYLSRTGVKARGTNL